MKLAAIVIFSIALIGTSAIMVVVNSGSKRSSYVFLTWIICLLAGGATIIVDRWKDNDSQLLFIVAFCVVAIVVTIIEAKVRNRKREKEVPNLAHK